MIDSLAYTDGFNQDWMIPLWILKEPVLMEPHEFIRIIGTIDGYYQTPLLVRSLLTLERVHAYHYACQNISRFCQYFLLSPVITLLTHV